MKERTALLLDLLQQAIHLRVLSLYCTEYWLQHQPQLLPVMCSLKHLTEVGVDILGPETSMFIHKMQCTPRKLILFHIDYYLYDLLTNDTMLRLDPNFRLASVQSLMALAEPILPGIEQLARAFPGTRGLQIRHKEPDPHGQPIPSINWPSLERIRGTCSSFVYWRHATGIHLLELIFDDVFDTPIEEESPRSSTTITEELRQRLRVLTPSRELSHALTAVTNIQPVALAVSVDSRVEVGFWAQLIRASARLRYLALELPDIRFYETVSADLIRWWDRVAPEFAASDVIC
ncbi:uncharacterized protein C8Q71DRAFT_364740 [Rhodofomes roseus]|uniref:Uncharacterized protein n=1 Tax=Rhodofomes roseus TaxID=34475 RepID=A0ABQ8K2H7_9APHY|nr:uncharacterized protein C8Q71DRAFT_364740 [Rhodofomes roseus]KAH9830433.1 hypothetical protein C8Q71DRAFT_364740 [Rhodofomes roseus]